MNILLFAGSGFEGTGGTEGFMRNLGKNLVQKGHNVSVLTHKRTGKEKDEIVEGMNVYYIPRFPKIKYFLPIYAIRFFLIFLMALKIRFKEKTNAILIREPESLAVLPLRIFGIKIFIRGCAILKHLKTEIKSHVKMKPVSSFLISFIRLYQKVVLNLATGLIESSKDEVKDVKKLVNREAYYIPYAIDERLFNKKEKKKGKTLIYHGYFRAIKRVELLIKLFDEIKKKERKAKLKLVGLIQKPYTKENLLELSENKKDIFFTGKVSKEDVAKNLREADIFIQCAVDFGNSPIEAAACGLPVVALGTFDEPFGIFCGDEKKFVDQTIKLLGNKNHYEKESQRNFQYVTKNRTWNKIAQQYIKVFGS